MGAGRPLRGAAGFPVANGEYLTGRPEPNSRCAVSKYGHPRSTGRSHGASVATAPTNLEEQNDGQ